MQISKRERYMLFFLIICIILFGYYRFIYTKQRNMVEQLKEQKTQAQQKLDTINMQIVSARSKEMNIRILNAKIQDKSQKLYPAIVQEKVILELNNLLQQSKVDGNIAFSEIGTKALDKEKEEQKEGKTSDSGQKPENKVTNSVQPLVDQYKNLTDAKKQGSKNSNSSAVQKNESGSTSNYAIDQMEVSLALSGKFEDVMSFIKSIENNSRTIVISNLTLSQSTSNQMTATLMLGFYAVPSIGEEDAEYLKWDISNPYGKSNPFDGTTTAQIGTTIEDANKVKKEEYSFVMSLKPIYSDLPTVMLGRANDTDRKTYVYSDQANAENVEIDLTEKDNKYYYKYKAGKSIYPSDFAGDGVEFQPGNSTIGLKVFSMKRMSAEDKASATIRVVNKTGKTVTVTIESDDAAAPRANIIGEGNTVSVSRN